MFRLILRGIKFTLDIIEWLGRILAIIKINYFPAYDPNLVFVEYLTQASLVKISPIYRPVNLELIKAV